MRLQSAGGQGAAEHDQEKSEARHGRTAIAGRRNPRCQRNGVGKEMAAKAVGEETVELSKAGSGHEVPRSGIESITPRLVRVSKVSQHHQKELTRGLLRIEGHVEAESEAEGKVGVLSALTLLP